MCTQIIPYHALLYICKIVITIFIHRKLVFDLAHAGGRPYLIKDVEELQKKIDAYFEECEGEMLTDPNGQPVLTKWGQVIYIGKKPPTVTGLALAIGLASRQALLNYQGRPEFNDAITRAKSRVEAYTEGRLFDKDGSNGAQFSLRNNFKGWKEEIADDGEKKEASPITVVLERRC